MSAPWSDQQTQQLAYLEEFAVTLQHVPGVNNEVADALSRSAQPASPPVDLSDQPPATDAVTVDQSNPSLTGMPRVVCSDQPPAAGAVWPSLIEYCTPALPGTQPAACSDQPRAADAEHVLFAVATPAPSAADLATAQEQENFQKKEN